MAGIPENFGSGGSGLTPNGSSGSPSLADILGGLNSVPAWETGIVVTTHVAVMTTAGFVMAVEGTAGNTAGPKSQIQSGAPATLQVDVQYDADGIATLTFNATDAITACAVVVLPRGASLV